MKKELYKLILVFIMISFSFALAFFIGREVTLAGQKYKSPTKKYIKKPKKSPVKIAPLPSINNTPTRNIAPSTPPAHTPPKATHSVPPSGLTHPKPISKKINSVMYGVFISQHTSKEKAMDKATQIKLRFPQWRLFVKRSGKTYTVYIGPFRHPKSAKSFLNQVENKKDFPSIRIQKIPIRSSKTK